MSRYDINQEHARLPLMAAVHEHFRWLRRKLMEAAIRATARYADTALWMPNPKHPILSVADANEYDADIHLVQESRRPRGHRFKTLRTLKLTQETTLQDVRVAAHHGITGFKGYPWEPGHDHVTTNSAGGVSDYYEKEDVIVEIFRQGMVLLTHPETVQDFCLDRQRNFIDVARFLCELAEKHDGRVTFEHATTAEMMNFVVNEVRHDNVLITVTLQHLLYTLDALLGGLLRPHLFCKPLLGTPEDLAAIRHVMFDLLHPRVCFASDSAPHYKWEKESDCGCAGCFTAPVVPEMLLQAALDAYDGDTKRALQFIVHATSDVPRSFYRLAPPSGVYELVRQPYRVPRTMGGGAPLFAGEELGWRFLRRVNAARIPLLQAA